MKNIGNVKQVLIIRIHRNAHNNLEMDQSGRIKNLLRQADIEQARSVGSLINPDILNEQMMT